MIFDLLTRAVTMHVPCLHLSIAVCALCILFAMAHEAVVKLLRRCYTYVHTVNSAPRLCLIMWCNITEG